MHSSSSFLFYSWIHLIEFFDVGTHNFPKISWITPQRVHILLLCDNFAANIYLGLLTLSSWEVTSAHVPTGDVLPGLEAGWAKRA